MKRQRNLSLLGLESSKGPVLLVVIPNKSSLLGLFQSLQGRGKDAHPTVRLSKLVCAEGLLFSKRNLRQKQNIAVAPKAEMSSIPCLGRTVSPVLVRQLDALVCH